jgi:tetratricopeptide repeat protein
MRKLLLATLAVALPLSSAALAQLTPERPLPGLPPLLDPTPDPQAPDSQTPDPQGPDAAPPDQQTPDQPPGVQPPPGQIAPDQQPLRPGPAPGPGTAPAQRQGNNGRPVPRQPETDEQLLTKLAQTKEQRDARPIERELRARWAHSPSPTADLLMRRVDQAMRAHDMDTARTIVQKLTDITPSFAEAWHRRATLAVEKDDFNDAIDSLRHVLRLQPKHFIAIAELAEILEQFGDKPGALKAYRQAKSLDPFIEGLDDRIKALTKEIEGQEI